MRGQGQTVVSFEQHVFRVIQSGIGKEPCARHGGLIFDQPVAFFTDHAMPVPEEIPEGDMFLCGPAPQRLEITAPVHAGAGFYKHREIGDLRLRGVDIWCP